MNPGSLGPESLPLSTPLVCRMGGTTAAQCSPGVPSPPWQAPPFSAIACHMGGGGFPEATRSLVTRRSQLGRTCVSKWLVTGLYSRVLLSASRCHCVCGFVCCSMMGLCSAHECVCLDASVLVSIAGFVLVSLTVSPCTHVGDCSVIVFFVAVTTFSVSVHCCVLCYCASVPDSLFACHCVFCEHAARISVSVTVSVTGCLRDCLCLRHSGPVTVALSISVTVCHRVYPSVCHHLPRCHCACVTHRPGHRWVCRAHWCQGCGPAHPTLADRGPGWAPICNPAPGKHQDPEPKGHLPHLRSCPSACSGLDQSPADSVPQTGNVP